MKKLILLLFAINLYAQSPKQVLYSFYDWKYPKIKIESTTIGVIVEDPSNNSVIDNQVSAYAIKNLNLRNLQIVAPEKSDYLLYIQPISTELTTSVEKINNINDVSYIGKIIFSSRLNFTIKRKNEIVYTKDFNYSQAISDVSTYNNYSIKTEEIANSQVQKLLKNSSVTIYQNCRDTYANTVLYHFFKEIKETIDFSRVEETLALYKFTDNDFEQINQSVDAFEFTRKLEDNEENYLKIKNLLLEKIQFWETEVSKYDYNNKKTKKIYWALMANISTAYYALGDNAKAIEFKDKALLVDYNKNYRYLSEIPEKKIKNLSFLLDSEGKPFIDFENNDFSKKQNFDAVYFTNKKGKLLINSNVSDQEIVIRKNRVEVIYHVLACSKFYDFLLSIVNDFNEKEEDKSLFFKNTDNYFFNLTKHYNDRSKELLVADLKNFNMEEKKTILTASNKIYDLTDVLYKRLEQSQKINSESQYSEFLKTIVKLQDLLAHYPGTSKKEDLKALTNMVFITQDQALLDLPYLGFLADELTTEGHSDYKSHPKMYQALFKQYKKTFNNLMASTVLKNLHDKEVIKFNEIMYSFYMPLSREKIENVNIKFKNQYNSDSILRLLMLYSK
ncbi:hypothetical protein B0A67_05405 [Flavobacterium aquidurense]|jgi:hypothetical protein|uniref:hypothetical protein n=1 Tax=Flavobacterium aquidurense TaxID=362413 RepID=UPI00091CABFC|nr:hypothetical protein [Flavobacterium aquidurense]OXA73111.1 hypothetical protein B0A67_05405 [Flavobacterium aquidurense]SHG18255.1 hypothetical protein SAMN05444481_102441 [Flavobacterium frigidimaris]